MRIPVLMYANEAVATDGLLRVVGGGWSFFAAAGFPVVVSGFIAGIFEVPPEESGVHEVGFHFEGADGHVDGSHGSITVLAMNDVAPDRPSLAPFAFPFGIEATAPNDLTVVITSNGRAIDRCTVPVVLAGD